MVILIAPSIGAGYLHAMRLQEIEQQALALTDQERAALVLSLIDTLAVPGTDIPDVEALRRDAEMQSGGVLPLSHDEFVRRVQQGRGE